MIDVELTGNWAGVAVALNRLPLLVHGAAVWGQRKVCEDLVKRVKGHINKQDLHWVERASSYNPSDPRTLVDTEAYYGAIQAFKTGMTYHAGVKSQAFNANGSRIVDYANMNEYGGGNLPARPLWEPSIKEMGGATGIRGIVVAAIFAKVVALRAVGFDVKLGKI